MAITVTREIFNQLLCHDCAKPLKDVMCDTCCECRDCFKGECVGKYSWCIEERPGLYVVYGSTSIFSPKHNATNLKWRF